jgi:hypothetical protein
MAGNDLMTALKIKQLTVTRLATRIGNAFQRCQTIITGSVVLFCDSATFVRDVLNSETK